MTQEPKTLGALLFLLLGGCSLLTGVFTPVCGDGFVQEGEACDDGNDDNTDSCVSDVDTGQICVLAICGDGVVGAGEECDDANNDDTDDCISSCSLASCGDGNIQTGVELCDDGNDDSNDGCSSVCSVEANSTCDGIPSICSRRELSQIEAGSDFNCAISAAGGGVHCWGKADKGQLGYGNNDTIGDDEFPVDAGAVVLNGPVEFISSGIEHSCGLFGGGNVACWGSDVGGILGYALGENIGDDESPDQVGFVQLGVVAAQVAVGGAHSCVITNTNGIKCWGLNGNGQLGYGNTSTIGDNELPSIINNVDIGTKLANKITLGSGHTCFLDSAKLVFCWGRGNKGQLGYGTSLQPNKDNIGDDADESAHNTVVPIGTANQLVAGDEHTCAVLVSGSVVCWGENSDGQLGLGNRNDLGDDEPASSANVVNFGGGVSVSQLSAGGAHTCALFLDGTAKCWGKNDKGQI
jgi:cysteine-rich repeat protein